MRPFADKEIALLENFAAQAVIAMENARLSTETREALEHQTATAEVLGVINSSPGDLGPVFDAILDKAHSLCGAEHGSLFTYDGELFWRVATQRRPPAQYSELVRAGFRPGPGNPFVGVLEGERLVHIADIRQGAGEQPDDPGLRVALEVGLRTFLIVPLRKDKLLLGVITAVRHEVRPFSDKQIALLENFAAQAVIAMENARLLTETREALEQQTATAEVLQVINSSPGDLTPVFDAMLEKAVRLCDSASGTMLRWDGERLHRVAWRGVAPEHIEATRQPVAPAPGTPGDRIVQGENVVCIADLAEEVASGRVPPVRSQAHFGGRSYVAVALRKDDRLLGVISIYRQEVRPFTEKQIALLQNFAAQAVIAMENARLITETREALDQQTATAEVLQVINSSPGDLTPVFDAILEKGHRFCGVVDGSLQLYDGEQFRAVATGFSGPLADWLRQGYRPGPNMPHQRLVDGEPFVHILDLAEIDDPAARSAVELSGTPHIALRRSAQRQRFSRPDRLRPQRGAAILRQTDRALAEFRGAGGHCDGKCPAP